jgi:hypothetical protein
MNQIDPITGLPNRRLTTDPITGRPVPTSGAPRVVSPVAFMSQGSPAAYRTYESRGITVDPRSDIEELRALRQSALDKWGNGLGKAGVILGTGVVDNTAGFLMGLGQYAAGGFGDFSEFADDMVNNPVSNLTRAAKDAATEALPNYYTNEEEQSTKLWSANFWADKFLGGAAYTGAAIASAWLTGGTGLATSGAKMGLNAAATGLKGTKAAAAYASGKSMLTSAAARGSKVASGIVEGAQRLPAATSYIESAAAMSMSEAGIEAAETNRAVREKLTQKYMSENGIEDENNIPLAVRQQIELQASQAEGAAFYGNLAVLMPSNLIMFGKMLKPFNPSSTLNPRVVSRVDDAGRVVAADSYATMSKTSRFLNDAATKLGPNVKGAFTEAFQEGAQSAIARGLEEFEVDRFYDAGTADMFETLIKGGSLKTLAAASKDIGEAAASSLENKDARESMLIGAIIGFLSGGRAGFTTAKQQESEAKKAIEMLNDPNFYNLQERAKTTNRSARYSALMEEAAQRGDMKAYYDYQMLLFQEEAIHHVQNGTYDVFVKKLEDAKNLTDEEFKANFGIEEGVQMDKNKHVDELKSRVEKFVKVVDKINTIYPGTQPPRGAQAMFMSKAKKEAIAEQINDEQLYKSALIRSAALREGLDARIESVINEITELSPNFDVEALNKTKTTNFAEIIGDKITTPKNEERNKILQDAVNNSATVEDAILLASKTAYLNQLMADKDFVDSAHRNMLLNPQERDLYVQRVKIREEQERQKIVDNAVDQAISSTVTSEELENSRSAFEAISNEAKLKYENELVNRKSAEADAVNKFNTLPRSEVAALDANSATPLELKLKDKYLEGRTQEEPLVTPQTTQASQTKKDTTNNNQNNSKTAAPEVNAPETTEDGSNPAAMSLEDLLIIEAKKAAEEVDKNAQRENRRAQTDAVEMVTRSGNQGQFVLNDQGKVVVDSNGEPVHSTFYDRRTKNGVPLLNVGYLTNPKVAVGSKVTIEVIEDDWWAENKDSGNALQTIPMYVKVDGEYVGILLSGTNQLRVAAYNAYLDGNNGVETEIEEKYVSNIFNARTEDGNVFFYNPVESLENDFIIAYVNENLEWVIGNPDRFTKDQINQYQNALSNAGQASKFAPGQVGFVVTDPNNQLRIIIGSTAKLSPEDVNNAYDILLGKYVKKFTELVGTNILPGDPGNRVYYDLVKTNGNFVFDLVDAEGQPLLRDVLGNNLINIPAEVIKNMAAGKPINSIPQTTINEMLVEYVVIDTTEKGVPVYGTRPVKNNLSQEQIEFVLSNLEQHVKNIIATKRYNIAGERINKSGEYTIQEGGVSKTYSSYLQYLTDPRSTGEYNGRLRTDAKAVNGSVFYDIGLKFRVDKIAAPQAPIEAPIETSTPVATPIVEAPQTQPELVTPTTKGNLKERKSRKGAATTETPATPVTAEPAPQPVVGASSEEQLVRDKLNKALDNYLKQENEYDYEFTFTDFQNSVLPLFREKFPNIVETWEAEQIKKYC